MKFAEYAKMYMALAGLLAAGALGVTGIPTGWKVVLQLVVAAAGAFAVWKVPNAGTVPPAPPGASVVVRESTEPVQENEDGGAVYNLADFRRRVEPPAYKLVA